MRAFLLLSAFSLDLSAEVVGLDLFLLPPPAILYFYFCFGLNHFTASQLVWFYVQNYVVLCSMFYVLCSELYHLCSELFHQELGALVRLKDTDAGLGFSLEHFIHLTIKYSDVLKYYNTDMGIQGRDRLVT